MAEYAGASSGVAYRYLSTSGQDVEAGWIGKIIRGVEEKFLSALNNSILSDNDKAIMTALYSNLVASSWWTASGYRDKMKVIIYKRHTTDYSTAKDGTRYGVGVVCMADSTTYDHNLVYGYVDYSLQAVCGVMNYFSDADVYSSSSKPKGWSPQFNMLAEGYGYDAYKWYYDDGTESAISQSYGQIGVYNLLPGSFGGTIYVWDYSEWENRATAWGASYPYNVGPSFSRLTDIYTEAPTGNYVGSYYLYDYEEDNKMVDFANIFCPTDAQLSTLKKELNSSTVWSAIKGFLQKPGEIVFYIGTSPIHPHVKYADGEYALQTGWWDEDIWTAEVEERYIEVNFGHISASIQANSYLLHPPYSHWYLFLPWVGVVEQDADYWIGHTVYLTAKFDFYTGRVMWRLAYDSSVSDPKYFASYCGNFISYSPISQTNQDALLSKAANILGTAVAGAVGDGVITVVTSSEKIATGAVAASNGFKQLTEGESLMKPLNMNMPLNVPNLESPVPPTTTKTYQGLTSDDVKAGVEIATSPVHSYTSALSASDTSLSYLIPYLYVDRQDIAISDTDTYRSQKGYPSMKIGTLSSYTGFTAVDSIHLDKVPALDGEKAEIESYLKSGVIL